MVKIFQYYNGYFKASGGIETHITDIVRFLDYNFDIITDAFPGYPLTEKFGENTVVWRFKPYNYSIIPTKNIRNSKPLFPYRVLTDAMRTHNIRKYLDNANFNLLHVHGANLGNAIMRLCFMLNTLVPIRKLIDFSFVKKPTILTLHGLGTLISERSIIKEFERSFIDQFDNVICVDKNIHSFIQNYCENTNQTKNIWFIQNGVDIKKFCPTPFLRSKKLKVGFVGRLEKSRGISLLVELIKDLPETVELYVAGAGNALDIERFKAKVDVSKFHFYMNIGYEEIPNFYKKIDVLFNPVIAEGISRVTLEAMSCGRPVIMIDKGNRYPVVDKKTSYLIKYDVKEVLSLLEDIHNNRDKVENAGREARKIVEKEFDIKDTISKIDEVYKSLICN